MTKLTCESFQSGFRTISKQIVLVNATNLVS